MAVEYLDPEIANEGSHAEAPIPGWMNAPDISAEEYQPDMEPPHVNDYSAFKKHKVYGKYFRPYRRQPFPAFVYNLIEGQQIVKTKEEAIALGALWTPFIPVWFHPTKGKVVVRSEEQVAALGVGWAPAMFDGNSKQWISGRDMTGKSLPVKNDVQRLAEAVVAGQAKNGGAIDANAIAAIIAATLQAMNKQPEPVTPAAAAATVAAMNLEANPANSGGDGPSPDHDIERTALLELAEKEGVKVDGRWSNKRIKEALGLD